MECNVPTPYYLGINTVWGHTMSKIKTQANAVLARFAGTNDHDKIRAARGICNSDSAFLRWARRGFDLQAIRDARTIQQTWKTFCGARSSLITLRAMQAALTKIGQAGVQLSRKVIVAMRDAAKRLATPAVTGDLFSPAGEGA